MTTPTITDLGTHKIIRYPQSWDKARCDVYAKEQGWGDVELFHLPMTELPWWGHIRGVPHSPQSAALKN